MGWEDMGPGAWNWPLAMGIAAMEAWTRALTDGQDDNARREEPQWATPNRLALDLAALRLRDFSQKDAGPPVVVVAPFAVHDAQLADLASGHSLVAALLANGCSRLFLVEWKSAEPATKLGTIDSQLAALNVAIDDAGAPVDLIGLCQGGWLSLLFAGRFPAKIGKLVLAGAPVDVKAAASALTRYVDQTPDVAFEQLISGGDGLLRGREMATLWPREESDEERLANSLQIDPPFSSAEAQNAVAAFRRWDRRALDLPGPYYREVVQHIYRENSLARGDFQALGRTPQLCALNHRLFVLAGETDAIAPPAQALAAATLVGGEVQTAIAPCGHLALFMGRETLGNEWLHIAQWLREK